MKKTGRILLVSLMTSSLVVTPVFAEPETDSLESQKAEAQSEAEALQQELVELLDKMGQLEEDLIAKGEEITQAEEDLKEAQELSDEQYEAMKLRIKYMYENGTTTALETLISAENFSDLLNKAEYVAEVHVYDREKLQEYVDTTEKIENLKDQLVEDQTNMQKMQAEYEAEEESLNTTLTEKREEIAGFDEQIQAAAEEAARLAAEREAEQNSGRDGGTGQSDGGAGTGSQGSGGNSGNTGSTGGTITSGGSGNNGNTGNTGNSGGSSGGGNSGGSSGNSGTSSGNTSVAQTIVNAAYGQLGVPYVMGGTGNGGWDCSGLVQYCHRVAGISLPRTSQAQGGCGAAVSNPQPGDIVCYGSHVGIYIGNGQMIHAPKPGDVVKVAAVYGSPWYRRCW